MLWLRGATASGRRAVLPAEPAGGSGRSSEAARGKLPPGDAWLICPGEEGPVSSSRWEALRDGVEDFELLCLLEQEQRAVAERLGLPADKVDHTEAGKRIAREITPSNDRTGWTG